MVYKTPQEWPCSLRYMKKSLNRNFFFFNDTATTEIYTLSLHDALPISLHLDQIPLPQQGDVAVADLVTRPHHQAVALGLAVPMRVERDDHVLARTGADLAGLEIGRAHV